MNMKTTQQHIGIGWQHESGGMVKCISREGVLLVDVPTPATKHDHWLLSLEEAEKRIGEFRPCGK